MIRLWPYAYGATIRHEFDTDHLNVWLTFRYPMDQDNKPDHGLWVLTVDDVPKAISSSAWQDEFTLLLVSDAVVLYPDRVLLSYEGPSGNLQTTWGKDWEPWSDILSTDISMEQHFVDRGMPVAWDFNVGDFTRDGAWHSMSMAHIIPKKTHAILMRLYVISTSVPRYVLFRKHKIGGIYNITDTRTQVANGPVGSDVICTTGDQQNIDYKVQDTTVIGLDVLIKGWWH